jgi:flagellar motor switch protein FliN/FliY
MGDMLSQAEIDALLSGASIDELIADSNEELLNDQEIDALGEIGNISMGTSATTLFTLLGQKVKITTPSVEITTWEEMSKEYKLPYVGVRVEYTKGLEGSNLLVLKEEDAKIITDLMMGGDGTNTDNEISDLHLSAISEAMNQMIGSSATSMSSMFNKRIDISPPKAFVIEFEAGSPYEGISEKDKIVKISFRMEIGSLVDSEIMQLLPLNFAKSLVENILNAQNETEELPEQNIQHTAPADDEREIRRGKSAQPHTQAGVNQTMNAAIDEDYDYEDTGYMQAAPRRSSRPVNVQPVQYQSFDDDSITIDKKNISLIMDVPLEVTVELGRTSKLIKDILEFSAGSIIELDKLAGEPVDILVNGKTIAKGEVVVIDESFGVRITDIIHPSKRLQ